MTGDGQEGDGDIWTNNISSEVVVVWCWICNNNENLRKSSTRKPHQPQVTGNPLINAETSLNIPAKPCGSAFVCID